LRLLVKSLEGNLSCKAHGVSLDPAQAALNAWSKPYIGGFFPQQLTLLRYRGIGAF
jgi:hypothetical protein